ncbi:MAG: glycosyl transferase [Thermodesulfobacteriota bacterium]
MTDFYQGGVITTFHRLGKPDLGRIEEELKSYARSKPVALVLPALFKDVQGEAMKGIMEELRKVEYIREIVLTLGHATDEEFKWVKEFMSVLPQEVKVIHNNGKRFTDIYRILDKEGVGAGHDGKGRSAWIAYGYILANRKSGVIALHDCDIVTYNREMLARLCYPVVNSKLDYVFCKGFYARVSDRLYGRVTRLFVTPLIRALIKLIGYHHLLLFLDSFRYPLAGEFCMITDLARVNRIPWDWGLEVGVLAEVYRNYSTRRVCQVDIADNYEHKHQVLSAEDPATGLTKMSIDITKSLFRSLTSEGMIISSAFFRSLVATYLKLAEDTIMRYEGDAAINGLFFDRHEDANAVDAFTKGISIAAKTIMENPLGAPLIPNWNRVNSAVPGILDILREAVSEDNR